MVTPPGVPDSTVKDMKPSFKKRYGDRWKEVLYATLWKHKSSYQEETLVENLPSSVIDTKRVSRTYNRRENQNYHIENAVMLAKLYGTPEEHAKGLDIMVRHKKLGYLPDDGIDYEYQMNKKYYPKLHNKNEETINEARKGARPVPGTEGQDRESYTDTQDRESYIVDDDHIKNMENYAKGNVRANWMKGFEKPGPEFQELINKEKAALAARKKQQAEADRNLKNYQDGNVRANWRKEETIIEERRPIHHIARDITKDWKKPYFGAVPYLQAMHSLETTKDMYGADTGSSVVAYFLGNANTYRGENARKYKQELKDHLKEETINEAQKGWNDQGEDYLDFSDEEQEGLKQAIKKRNRDTYSDALKAKFDRIATPGQRGPTDPNLLNIIHKFAVKRNELLKRIRKADEETQLDEISVFALDRFHKAAEKEIDRLEGKETEYKNKGWKRKAHAVSDRIIKHQVYGTERADDMIKKKTGSYNPSLIHKIANKIHDIELGKNLKKEDAWRQDNKNRQFKKAQFKESLDEHIVKHGSGYRLLSHKGKNLGTFKTRAAAAKHEGEVEWFKKHPREETQIDEAKKGKSWNPPEVQAKAAKEKKEQRMFDSAKREINRQRKAELKPTHRAVGKWEYEHIIKGKPIK